jgi:outer membrane translocation and assembly module TamA
LTVRADSTSKFDLDINVPIIDGWEFDYSSFGAGPVVKYDSRDNIFTPNRGAEIDFSALFYRGTGPISSDHNYEITKAQSKIYFPLGEQYVLGWRLDGRFSSGDVPFFALPYIELRGIPVMRYQGRHTGVTEAELRYNLTHRWAIVGFGGVGQAVSNMSEFGHVPTRWGVGGGFRYLTARKLGMYAGVDVARGPEEWAVYLQVGTGW